VVHTLLAREWKGGQANITHKTKVFIIKCFVIIQIIQDTYLTLHMCKLGGRVLKYSDINVSRGWKVVKNKRLKYLSVISTSGCRAEKSLFNNICMKNCY